MSGRKRTAGSRWVLLGVLVLCMAGGGAAPRLRAQARMQAVSHSQQGIAERSTPINTVPEKREQEKDENAEYTHSAAVRKLGALVGMNPDQAAITFEVLNFLVLAIGLAYLAMKTLPKQFRDRSSHIQRQLVDARTATEEASARLTAVESRLEKLDSEIAGMRAQMEAETVREEHRMRAALEEETAKVLAAADSEIQAATAMARRELQRHAAELAIEHAAKRLVVSTETDRLLIRSFAGRLTGEHGGQN